MKKIIFYSSLVIAIVLLINIINILTTDLTRLTEFGYGYLVGKIILFFVFIGIVLFTRKTLKAKNTVYNG